MEKKIIPVKKNESYVLKIEKLGSHGEGIGKIDGFTLFVEGTMPGDEIEVKIIKVKKSYAIGKVSKIIEPSKDRVEPICSVAKRCGGCTLQHVAYERQLNYKQEIIISALERIGGIHREKIETKIAPILGMEDPYFYRNKVQYPVRNENGAIKIGFYAKRSHQVIEAPKCYIQDEYNEKMIEVIKKFMLEHKITAYNEEQHKGLVRHIIIRKSTVLHKFHLMLVINGEGFSREIEEKLIDTVSKLEKVDGISININKKRTNTILGREVRLLYGNQYLYDEIDDVKFHISPLSFYQVNHGQTVKLYKKALEFADIQEDETVFDLYCGIGTISLFLAQKAKEVYGVEIIEEAIEDAKKNATLNKMENAHFYTGKAEEIMPKIYKEQNIVASTVVVDPPRKGCDQELLNTMIKMNPNKIVYVSCDPATLARDVKLLSEGGYEIEKIQGVDMFGHSTHVETIVRLGNQAKK